jgi:putative ABC transport system permease protein
MLQDLRVAARALRATPIVSIVAVFSLALGIGANTAIFSLVNSLLLRSLPVENPAQLAILLDAPTKGESEWNYPVWDQVRRQTEIVDGTLAWSAQTFNLAEGGEAEVVSGLWASGSFFETLGVPSVLGRTFTDADDQRGGGPDGPVAVISYRFWQRRYAGAADVIGRRLSVERVPFTIIGVASPGFFGPEVGRSFDIAIPIGTEPLIHGAKEARLDRVSHTWLTIMVRLKSGQAIGAATAALRGVQPQIREATLPTDWPADELQAYLKGPFTLVPAATGLSSLRRLYQQPLLIMLAAVALVLLIACANIANLMLARATARRHEWSLRLALGASRWRLVRLLLTESLLLSGIGAGLGLLLANWAGRLLVQQISTHGNTFFLDLSLDGRVLTFTSAVTVLTVLLFGVAPAIRAATVAPMSALKDQARGTSSRAYTSHTSALVVVQVALSVVLVVSAGLFIRTFNSLEAVPLGFDREGVLVANIAGQRANIPPAERAATFERIRQQLRTAPNVKSAAVSFVTPVSGDSWNNRIEVSDGVPLPERARQAKLNVVTPDWLATFGTRLVAGRDITERDTKDSPRVILVNEAFARQFLNGASPLGHSVRKTGVVRTPPREIVGLVADAVYLNLREPPPPTMYVPLAQYDTALPVNVAFSVRPVFGPPALLARSVAAAITSVRSDLDLTLIPLAVQVEESLTQERMTATLSAFFGGLALLLAGLGLYGVASYAVNMRRMEIGIRIALGAAPSSVVTLVLRRVAILVLIGVTIGGAAAMWASRFVATLLYGIAPRDPIVLIGSAVILAVVGILAGWLPARSASQIDPANVLKKS